MIAKVALYEGQDEGDERLPGEYFSARMAILTTISSLSADWAEERVMTSSPTTSSEFVSSTSTKMRSSALLW